MQGLEPVGTGSNTEVSRSRRGKVPTCTNARGWHRARVKVKDRLGNSKCVFVHKRDEPKVFSLKRLKNITKHLSVPNVKSN